ncbi:MAG: hypothetical protein AAGD33_03435 [Actinomycetota bacterium]
MSERVDQRLLDGPVGQAGGLVVLDDVISPTGVRELRREALDVGRTAERHLGTTKRVDAGRFDVPGRALGSGPGGPAQDRSYHSSRVISHLSSWCGTRLAPTGGRGTYSYYTRPGDHLDAHVDIRGCDVTLITVLHDSTPADDHAGRLVAWTGELGSSLDAVRRGGAPATVVEVPVGASVLLLGGLLPHAVLPLGSDGGRVVSALCYEAS